MREVVPLGEPAPFITYGYRPSGKRVFRSPFYFVVWRQRGLTFSTYCNPKGWCFDGWYFAYRFIIRVYFKSSALYRRRGINYFLWIRIQIWNCYGVCAIEWSFEIHLCGRGISRNFNISSFYLTILERLSASPLAPDSVAFIPFPHRFCGNVQLDN